MQYGDRLLADDEDLVRSAGCCRDEHEVASHECPLAHTISRKVDNHA